MAERNTLSPSESLYPVGSEAELVLVTPEMASDWLTTRRWPSQRNISPATVAKYLRDMMAGQWKVTRQGLIFDTNGYNIDGQHRLRALANADAETLKRHYGEPGIYFWVYPDEATDTYDAYDQNFRRTAAHLLHEPYSGAIAASARFLAAALDGDRFGFPRMPRVNTTETLSVKRQWPELTWYVARVNQAYKPSRLPVPEHNAMLAMAARTEHAPKIEDWIDRVHYGDGMQHNDPRLHLRNRFITSWATLTGSRNRPRRWAFMLKAWNAYVRGEGLPVLRWSALEELPRMEGFTFPGETTEDK